MNEPLTMVDVENRIVALCDLLEVETEAYAELSSQRAEAEADYKYRYSRAFVEQAGKVPVASKEAVANLRSSNEFRSYRILEARERATQLKLTGIRAQLDSLRTIAANVRKLTV